MEAEVIDVATSIHADLPEGHAFGVIKQGRAEALIVPGDGLFFSQARRIAELAVQQHLPTLFSTREPVQIGGLMSYGPNLAEQFYRAATYVDKILRGAHPGDLPVEQPTTCVALTDFT